MSSSFSVFVKRIKIISAGGAARLLAALSSVLISIIVVRTQSSDLWGGLIPFILILEFGFSVVGFGSFPYLVQKFSLHPHQIRAAWSQSFFSRSALLVLLLIVIPLLGYSTSIRIYLIIWAVGRYVFQSFEPIAQVERNFLFSIMMELIAIAIIAFPLIRNENNISIDTLVLLFAASMVWRSTVSVIFFREWISYSRPGLAYFKAAAPFFLLTISGMLQQRTDLYCVTYFLDDQETAVYQVYFNFLIFSQFLSSLLLSPFAKNIFRLSSLSLRKLERKFMLAGIPLSIASLAAIYLMVKYLYHFELSWFMYALGYFYILMFYLYLLRNYELGKFYRQTTVAIYGFLGSALNLILCTILIPRFSMEGALVAGLSAQVLIVVLFRRPKAMSHAQG